MAFHYDLLVPLLPSSGAAVVEVLLQEGAPIEPGDIVARLAIGDHLFEVLANGIGFIGSIHANPGQQTQVGEPVARVYADGEEIPYGRPYSLLRDPILTEVQEHTCRRVQSAYVEAALNMKVGIASNVGSDLQPLNALRHPPDRTTTGWYVWSGETLGDEPDLFAPAHVMHLRERCPELLPYLGLAPGWRVLLAPDYEDVWFDPALLAV